MSLSVSSQHLVMLQKGQKYKEAEMAFGKTVKRKENKERICKKRFLGGV